MTCDCFYIVRGDNTIEAARELAKAIDAAAMSKTEEVIPVYICVANNDFHATSDYDNFNTPFLVKKGTYLVHTHGKDYSMYRVRPKGGRRAFPDHYKVDFWNSFDKYILGVEPVRLED